MSSLKAWPWIANKLFASARSIYLRSSVSAWLGYRNEPKVRHKPEKKKAELYSLLLMLWLYVMVVKWHNNVFFFCFFKDADSACTDTCTCSYSRQLKSQSWLLTSWPFGVGGDKLATQKHPKTHQGRKMIIIGSRRTRHTKGSFILLLSHCEIVGWLRKMMVLP